MYVYYTCIECFWMCKQDYLVFSSIYSVFVYHGYTKVNISPWWLGTWLNIFPTSKQPNNRFIQSEKSSWLLWQWLQISSWYCEFLLFIQPWNARTKLDVVGLTLFCTDKQTEWIAMLTTKSLSIMNWIIVQKSWLIEAFPALVISV